MSKKDHNWVPLPAPGFTVYSWCSTCGYLRFLSESRTLYKSPSQKAGFVDYPFPVEPECFDPVERYEDGLIKTFQDELDGGCLACTDDEACQTCMQIARTIGAIKGRRDRRQNRKPHHLRNCDGNPCECGAEPPKRETKDEWHARMMRETEGMTKPGDVLAHLSADGKKNGLPP